MDLFFMTGPEQSAGSSRSSPGHPGRQETDHNLHFEYQVRFPSDGLPSLLTGLGSLVSLFALLDNDSLAQHNGAMAANADKRLAPFMFPAGVADTEIAARLFNNFRELAGMFQRWRSEAAMRRQTLVRDRLS